MLGDEPAARSALLQKASVADALAAASRRAEANIALARWAWRLRGWCSSVFFGGILLHVSIGCIKHSARQVGVRVVWVMQLCGVWYQTAHVCC